MKTHPMLFSGPMIRALLDGRKTQTRRILKPQPDDVFFAADGSVLSMQCTTSEPSGRKGFCAIDPKVFAVGDLIWVRETFRLHTIADLCKPSIMLSGDPVQFEADGAIHGDITQNGGFVPGKTRVSIHMPRWASRITLEITDVRVQRLQDISDQDCIAEGIEQISTSTEMGFATPIWQDYLEKVPYGFDSPIDSFRTLWNSINGPDAWDQNPWVVAYSFTVHQCNVDQMGESA